MPKPKKGKGDATKAKKEDGYSFEMNDHFKVEGPSPGLINLLPKLPNGFQEVTFKMKITENFVTGKPKYEIASYECKMMNKDLKDTLDLRVFNVTIPDSGKMLLVDPKKTQGNYPLWSLDPITGKGEPIEYPLIIYHDKASEKIFLLDITKFDEGKLEFKDHNTHKLHTADLTKRTNPLKWRDITSEPYGDTKWKFLGLIRDGYYYVLKSEDFKMIVIVDFNGCVVEDLGRYSVKYDEETNTTELIYVFNEGNESETSNNEEDKQIILSISGKVGLSMPASESIHSLESKEENALVPFVDNTETMSGNGNGYTKQIELLHNNGLEGNANDRNYLNLNRQGHANIRYLLSNGNENNAFPDRDILINGNGFNGHKNQRKSNGYSDMNNNGFNVHRDQSLETLGNHRNHSHMKMPKDLATIKKKGNSLSVKNTSKSKNMNGKKKNLEEREIARNDVPKPEEMTLSKLLTHKRNQKAQNVLTKEEKYFQDMKHEEARSILHQVRTLIFINSERSKILKIIMELIEINKEIISCTLTQKKSKENKYIWTQMMDKRRREEEFAKDLIKSYDNVYNKQLLKERMLNKMDRESELLLGKLDYLLNREKTAFRNVMNNQISEDCKQIIRYTNVPCYRNVKQIVIKETEMLLEKEIQQLKTEVCELLNGDKLKQLQKL